MCGRFVTLTYEEVAEVVAAVERGDGLASLARREGRAQAYPGSAVDAVSKVANAANRVQASRFTWGFTPSWSKKTIFNTRLESALSGSGMWTDMVNGGRCIVPAAAFFEPHVTETVRSPRTGRPMKRAYTFAQPDGTPLLLAGLHDGERCSIVTTEPNSWVSPVHNRMPLVLRFQEVPLWLEGGMHDLAQLADRAALELTVAPEALPESATPPAVEDSNQLSLF